MNWNFARGDEPTRRITLLVDGQVFAKFMRARIKRSLKEICGSFELEYVDEGRLAGTLRDLVSPPPYFRALQAGQAVELRIDDEPVLKGFIGKVSGKQEPAEIPATVHGRDICGDLVDCAASPTGPAEWKNLNLQQLTSQICAPFKIGVQVQTDIGAPFPTLGITPHEKAMPTIEKAARQRAVLITSDGVANLVLTTAGSTRAPAPLTVGGNVVSAGFEDDWDHRFSDVYVKGQTARANGNHAGVAAPLNPTMAPTGTGTGPDTTATAKEAAGIVMTGHATDPEITRYRPDVRVVNTQSGSSSVQAQAEWHVRIDQGQAKRYSYTVQDWRAGDANALWRPNQLVAVYDPYALLDDDMLIEGVDFLYSENGSTTEIHVVGKTAYDRINEPARKRARHKGRT